MEREHRLRRVYGTGSLTIRTMADGTRVYYGAVRDNAGRQVKRRLGPVRSPRQADGLTKSKAEALLRDLISTARTVTSVEHTASSGSPSEHRPAEVEAVGGRLRRPRLRQLGVVGWDVSEANRIILAFGPMAVPVSPNDRLLYLDDGPPGCRIRRQDGYACWGAVGTGEICWRHQRGESLWPDGHAEAALACAKAPAGGGVYFLVGGPLVKIGRAASFANRIAAIRAMSPIPLTTHRLVTHLRPVDLERALHRRFAAAREHGEWFRADAVLPILDAATDSDIRAHAQLRPYVIRGDERTLARWFGTPEGRSVHGLGHLGLLTVEQSQPGRTGR